ncbi:MAG: glycosyltransferase [Candidatus Kapabacteria bacterium]|nr:glycosyltransferase [Candidatus Kapabacteria bacterium]
MNIIDYIFWFSFWGIVYPFAIYPVLLFLLKNIFSKDVLKSNLFRPEITILIAAHNEERYIEDCIKSILNSDYPKEKISVIVGSDESTDKTNSILEVFSSEYTNIVFYKFDRIGKNAVINKLYEYVKSDFVFFFDTDCRVENNTISTLVDNFADENVGGVMSKI